MRLKPDIDWHSSYIDVYGSIHCPTAIKSILENIKIAFNAKLHPKLTEDGTSGAYCMRNPAK